MWLGSAERRATQSRTVIEGNARLRYDVHANSSRRHPVQNVGSKLVRYVNGRPVIIHNGRPVSQAAYCDYIIWDDWKDRVRGFIESGVAIFYLRPHPDEVSTFWGDDPAGRKKETRALVTLAEQAEFVLGLEPEALFYMRPGSTVRVIGTLPW